MAKYVVLFGFSGVTVRGFIAKPSDRVAIVRELAESVGGTLECCYWMFGQYDGLAILELPDSLTAAAVSLALTGSGAYSKFETHELIDPGDYARIAERARQISYQPPGA
jgi:uncharacterized protein with GYD domain